MRLFGSEKAINTFTRLGVDENIGLDAGILSSAVERAQTKIENNNYGI